MKKCSEASCMRFFFHRQLHILHQELVSAQTTLARLGLL